MIPLRDTIPSKTFPLVTLALIGLNIYIFFFIVTLDIETAKEVFKTYGLVPSSFVSIFRGVSEQDLSYSLTSLFSCMFLHGGLGHLFSNMWTLWLFGDNVEDEMGPVSFFFFYLFAGLGATLIHVLMNPNSEVPIVGASGAISGVMGAYLVLFPRSQLLMFFLLIFYPIFFYVPTVIYLLIWFVGQFLSGAASLSSPTVSGGIAFWAHIGGFMIGLLTFPIFLKPKRQSWKGRS